MPQFDHDTALPAHHVGDEEWLEQDPMILEELNARTLEGAWRGVNVLGRGAAGRVGAWVKVNVDGDNLDSVAIKDADPAHWRTWHDPVDTSRDQLLQPIAISERIRLQGENIPTIPRGRRVRKSLPSNPALSGFLAPTHEPTLWEIEAGLIEDEKLQHKDLAQQQPGYDEWNIFEDRSYKA
ncbi:hypothetical protein T440DRAFT_522516 [Plenodomus tracheiphilus IPT5]|uniref:Protein kinase domain-containing protein n=1 Tax=Plenodomus tracheiphilus IPT5 TaxID=1408161 RepID=A0A6A7ARE9_9PLEO|nr:hypothetical protein T440DRAFT_522516 [Plenodomus tracheiphilus IPT5]